MNNFWIAVFYGLAMFWIGYLVRPQSQLFIYVLMWGVILVWFKILEIKEKEVKK